MGGARSEFSQEMHRRRLAAGLSLADLAELTHYHKAHLSKVENGKRAPMPRLAGLVDTALHAGGVLVRLAAARQTSRGTHSRPSRAATLTAVRPPSRLAADLDPAVPALFTASLADVRALGQRYGAGVVLPKVIGDLHTLLGLAGAARGEDRFRLLVLASRFAEYAGWMAQEAGDLPATARWTARAVALAAEGGDHAMAAYALVRHALIALHDGDPIRTVELARRAAASDHATRRVRGLAAQREAQGHALLGDHVSFHRAMARAETLLAEPDATELPVLGTSTLTRPTPLTAAWSLLDLGQPERSAAALEREIRHIPATAPRTYARFGVRCALSHAIARDLDRACQLVRQLIPTLTDLNSATIGQDLCRLTNRLECWPNHPPVRTVMPDLKTVLSALPAPAGT